MKRRIKILGLVVTVIALALLVQRILEVASIVPRVRVGALSRTVETGDRLRLFVLGDTGTGDDAQRRVADAMEARCEAVGADGIVLLGDNFYMEGVDSVTDRQWKTKVFDMYGGPCLREVPIYPVLGNHDYRGNAAAQIEMSARNPRWRMPNRFYSVDFGYLVKLIAFDSQISDFCLKPSFCSVDFLLDEVEKHTTVWTVVSAHHPLASASGHAYGHGGGFRGLLLTPLLCDRVDAYLAGHSHHLEHRVVRDCRLEIFISGGGGGDLYELADEPDDAMRFGAAQHGFLELEATRARLAFRFFDTEGNQLYESVKVDDEE